MKFSRLLLAICLSFTSLQTFADNAPKAEVVDAIDVLRQQYAELEDLRNQVKLIVEAGETDKIVLIIASSLVGAGLIIDVFSPAKPEAVQLTRDKIGDAMITIGLGGGLITSIVVLLDEQKAKKIEERIRAQQDKIEQTVKGML